MIFLIEYAPPEGKLVTFKKFDDAQRTAAQDERLALELDLLRKGIGHEVVLLEAENEEMVRRSHARYFQTMKEIVENFRRAAGEFAAHAPGE